jgi:GTPase SAR1 family protein
MMFKVVCVGDSSVGKTHILHMFVHGALPPTTQATLGVDFMMKSIKIDLP